MIKEIHPQIYPNKNTIQIFFSLHLHVDYELFEDFKVYKSKFFGTEIIVQ